MDRRTVIRRGAQLVGGAAASRLVGSARAAGDSYPAQPIRIVVPTSPSTPPDIICRVVAAELTRAEGWNIVVENKPGAVGTIAAADVLRQPADGYTLYATSLPIVAGPALLPRMGYRLDTDFVPVVKLSVSYNVLVDNPSVPAKTVGELVAYLKARDGKANFSSGGFGTPAHLIGELFKLQAGVQAAHIPYNSLPQAIGDLIGGANQYMFVTILPVVALIEAGQLRALAVTAPRRVAALQDASRASSRQAIQASSPKIGSGFSQNPGRRPRSSCGSTPSSTRRSRARAVRATLMRIGAEPAGGTPEAFGAYFGEQLTHWQKVVTDSGIKMSPQ